uniref:F-box domain-containing protein n=1 Tax=Leersia perrieri TaxID=77586 RepID=A0A0D9WX55_9ORYZ
MGTGCSSSMLTKQIRRMPDSSNSGIVPLDVLFEVLVRLPAKELCRLRIICRQWWSLTSDHLFIKAHMARHQEQLLLASFKDDETHVHIIDFSGNVIKQISIPAGHKVLCTRLDLVSVASDTNSCHVLNLVSGDVYSLPESPAEEHMYHVSLRTPYTSFALGHVASTGEYKMLRIFNSPVSSRVPLIGNSPQQPSVTGMGTVTYNR